MSNHKFKTQQMSAVSMAIASMLAFGGYSGGVAAAPKLLLQKSVTVANSACDASTVETIKVGQGTRLKYCYSLRNGSTAGEDLFDVSISEGRGTATANDDALIQFTSIVGLTDLDGDGRADDLAAGSAAKARYVFTTGAAGVYRGPATIAASASSGGARSVTARNNATVVVSEDKMRSMVVRKTVVEATQSCPGTVSLSGVFSGDSIKYCYEVENLGDFDIEDLKVSDNNGGGANFLVNMNGLHDIDGDGDRGDLMPGAIAIGEVVQPITQSEGTTITAGTVAQSANLYKRAATQVTVAAGGEGACSVEMTAVPQTGVCPGGSGYEFTGPNAQFCYRVVNTGATALSNVQISDNGHASPIIASLPTLAAGASSAWQTRINAAFAGRYDDHVSSAVAEDVFGNAVACTGDGATAVKAADTSPPSPDVFLEKKVSLNGICTVTENNGVPPTLYDEVTVPKGTKVWYCYKMRNNLSVRWPYNDGTVPNGELTDPQFPGEQLYHFKLNIWATSELTARAGPIEVNETLQTTSTLRVTTLNPNAFFHDGTTVRVEEGNLRLTKHSANSHVDARVSNRINYDLVVDNTASALMRRVVITDTLSPDVKFISAPGCSYNSTNHKVFCNLGNMAGGTQSVRTIEVASQKLFGLIENNACVSSAAGETTSVDNCSKQQTQMHVGATRNRLFWENNEAGVQQCLTRNNDILNVGFARLQDEAVDNEVDAYELPSTSASRVGDVGGQSDSALSLVLGLFNSSETKLLNNQPRSNHASWCLRAAREVAAATCNIKNFGAKDVIRLGRLRTLIGTNCGYAASTRVTNVRVTRLKAYTERLREFNEAGMSVASPAVNAANPLTLTADDPTDRRD